MRVQPVTWFSPKRPVEGNTTYIRPDRPVEGGTVNVRPELDILVQELARLQRIEAAARAYSESTRDSDPRDPNQTWRDLNDVLARNPPTP